jgi:hypothetical protein
LQIVSWASRQLFGIAMAVSDVHLQKLQRPIRCTVYGNVTEARRAQCLKARSPIDVHPDPTFTVVKTPQS